MAGRQHKRRTRPRDAIGVIERHLKEKEELGVAAPGLSDCPKQTTRCSPLLINAEIEGGLMGRQQGCQATRRSSLGYPISDHGAGR